MSIELCTCPECGLPAEVVSDSECAHSPDTDLVGVRCIARHWFFGLRERLVA
jgi:hypothetical protein